MIKLVEIISSLERKDGAEVLFASIVNFIKNNKDIDLHVIVLYEGINDSFLEQLSNVKVCVVGKKAGIDLRCAKKLKKIISDINPDIIHSHLSCINTYYLAFGKRKYNWTVVHTLHNIPIKESNLTSRLLIKKLLLRKTLILVGISDSISKLATNYYSVDTVKTIYNGVELPIIDVAKELKRKKYDFVCVARFVEQKKSPTFNRCLSKSLQQV